MLDLLTDFTFRTVAIGAALLGMVSGGLGAFAVLRRQSLLGDAVSHAALPGIAIAFLLTGTKVSALLMLGALVAGWLGTLCVMGITRTTRISYDSALGLVLSVFFGIGLVLLTVIQRQPNANQAGLSSFLFGQAAALVTSDLITMAVLGGIVLVLLAVFWKEFVILAFDEEFGQSLGFPMRRLDILLTTLLVIAIVIGLQAVGVVLMSAMLIAPAAAARQWTDRLGTMVILGGFFGALSGVSGAFLSSTITRLPTGPTIVLCVSIIVFISLVASPRRGLVMRWLRHRRQVKSLGLEAVLLDLYALAQQHGQPDHPHEETALAVMNPYGVPVRYSLEQLLRRAWVSQPQPGFWALTAMGHRHAQGLIAERMNKGEGDA